MKHAALLLAAIGSLLLALCGFAAHGVWEMRSHGIRVEAEVVALERSGSNKPLYAPRFRFHAAAQEVTATLSTYERYPPFAVGDRVLIAYLAEDPSKIVVLARDHQLHAAFGFGVAALALLLLANLVRSAASHGDSGVLVAGVFLYIGLGLFAAAAYLSGDTLLLLRDGLRAEGIVLNGQGETRDGGGNRPQRDAQIEFTTQDGRRIAMTSDGVNADYQPQNARLPLAYRIELPRAAQVVSFEGLWFPVLMLMLPAVLFTAIGLGVKRLTGKPARRRKTPADAPAKPAERQALDAATIAEVGALLRENRKIDAIRLYRERSKCDLLTAKNACEALENGT